MDDENEIKIVLLGQTSVGKTCIVNYFVVGRFDNSVSPTLGASYASKNFKVNDTQVSMQIWDTAGQERFRVLAPMYYRGAQAALLVYSITDQTSFAEIDYWSRNLKENSTGDVELFLIGNKIDQADLRTVKEEEGQDKARAMGATFFETSAATGVGIEDLFVTVAKKCLEQAASNSQCSTTDQMKSSVDVTTNENNKKSCKC